ncbi:MAG: hypothetical protein HYW48_08115 [Deltaproteobacteria bacterium]|nr:hypothetical protein [Deltaproteobacteria bacterium]
MLRVRRVATLALCSILFLMSTCKKSHEEEQTLSGQQLGNISYQTVNNEKIPVLEFPLNKGEFFRYKICDKQSCVEDFSSESKLNLVGFVPGANSLQFRRCQFSGQSDDGKCSPWSEERKITFDSYNDQTMFDVHRLTLSLNIEMSETLTELYNSFEAHKNSLDVCLGNNQEEDTFKKSVEDYRGSVDELIENGPEFFQEQYHRQGQINFSSFGQKLSLGLATPGQVGAIRVRLITWHPEKIDPSIALLKMFGHSALLIGDETPSPRRVYISWAMGNSYEVDAARFGTTRRVITELPPMTEEQFESFHKWFQQTVYFEEKNIYDSGLKSHLAEVKESLKTRLNLSTNEALEAYLKRADFLTGFDDYERLRTSEPEILQKLQVDMRNYVFLRDNLESYSTLTSSLKAEMGLLEGEDIYWHHIFPSEQQRLKPELAYPKFEQLSVAGRAKIAHNLQTYRTMRERMMGAQNSYGREYNILTHNCAAVTGTCLGRIYKKDFGGGIMSIPSRVEAQARTFAQEFATAQRLQGVDASTKSTSPDKGVGGKGTSVAVVAGTLAVRAMLLTESSMNQSFTSCVQQSLDSFGDAFSRLLTEVGYIEHKREVLDRVLKPL